MPMLDLQRRLREAGRIRIGRQVLTANGKKRPEKLSQFRLTSADKTAIEAAAVLYGGDVHHWAEAPVGEQYEVFTETNTLPVVVPPAATALSQWWELWSGGGCLRRCDGEREVLSEQPCICAGEDERECKPTTRLNVILRDLPGLGVWRLESHGFNAATELAGTVEVCMAAASRGQLLPAVLRLEQRQVKRIIDGKAVTRNFAVPTLDIALAPGALGVVLGQPAIDTTSPAALPASGETWQPIPTPADLYGDPESIAEQIRTPTPTPPTRKTAKNAAEPIPATGLRPRGAPTERAELGGHAQITEPQMRKMRALYKGAGIQDAEQKRLAALICGLDSLESHTTLTTAQASQIIERLEQISAGKWEVILDSDANIIGTRAIPEQQTLT